ncbi:MAG: PAS domain S-box protein [Gemmatimonadetes bacterium]|nr:MAG: PAS domain S-box protein [Gemmatimonadota bacterium]
MDKPAVILLIDESQKLALLLESVLEDAGYHFLWESDGITGLERIQETHPDLVLLDSTLPGMSGEAVFQEMMTNPQYSDCRDIPVIMLSAKRSDSSIRRRLLELGLSVYLLKPFGTSELLNIIDNVLVTSNIRGQNKKLQRELGRTQNYLENLVQITPAAIFVIDLQRDTIDFFNKEAEIQTGYSLRELKLRNVQLFPETYAPRYQKLLDRLRQGETILAEEIPVVQKNGSVRWTLQNIVPVEDDKGNIHTAQGVSFDITNLKEAERELEHRNRELTIINTITKAISSSLDIEFMFRVVVQELSQMILIDRANLVLFEVQAHSAPIGGHLTLQLDIDYASILALYRVGEGYRQRLLEHQSMKSTAAEWIVYSRRRHIERDMALSHFAEDKLLLKEGLRSAVRLPLVFEEKIIGVLELFSRKLESHAAKDLSLLEQVADELAIAIRNAQLFRELRHSHAEVLAAKEFTEGIIQNAASGILTIDRESRITTFNQAAEGILLWKREEVVRQPVQNVMDLSTLAEELDLADPFREVIEQGVVMSQKETVIRRKDDVEIPIGISIAPLRGNDRVVGAVVLFSDLTLIKAIEEEQQKLKHLAQMGEMSARIAHEIKNSLAALQTGIQVAQATAASDEDASQMDALLDEIKRMDRIVKDLLRFSREPELHLSLVPIREMLMSPVYNIRMILEEYDNIEFVEEYDDNLPELFIDEGKMEQVFINLLQNALQAMPNGGRLTLRVKKNINFQMGVETVFIEVSDTGVGIPPEQQERIFDPFFSTKTEGTGLGLALSKRFVEAHGATITVHSQKGQGTTFRVELVVHRPPETETGAESAEFFAHQQHL